MVNPKLTEGSGLVNVYVWRSEALSNIIFKILAKPAFSS